MTKPSTIQPSDVREVVARLIGSFPTHDDDRGPDNETLIDWLPAQPGEAMSGEAFLYKLTDAILALINPSQQGLGAAGEDYGLPELPCADAGPDSPRSPVAWRVKDFADGWILFHTEAEARREAEGAGNLVQPLYTDNRDV